MPLRTLPSESPSHFWEIVIKVCVVTAFVILVTGLVIPLRPRLAEYQALNEKGRVLEAERAALQREIERRESELQMLERDPLFVEVKARDTLDMCQPGEVVFRFEDGGSAE
jgi:cell division protein FtsB